MGFQQRRARAPFDVLKLHDRAARVFVMLRRDPAAVRSISLAVAAAAENRPELAAALRGLREVLDEDPDARA
jgi:hypothetical protein